MTDVLFVYRSLLPTVQMTHGEGRGLTAVPLTRFQKVVRVAVSSVVPKGQLKSDGETDIVEDYTTHYNCCPPPLFMFIISIAEVSNVVHVFWFCNCVLKFLRHTLQLHLEKAGNNVAELNECK